MPHTVLALVGFFTETWVTENGQKIWIMDCKETWLKTAMKELAQYMLH
jgi:hypothetical protein